MTLLEFNEDIRDGVQEIANIAVGQAADRLARGFSTFVEIPIPQVHLIEAADIMMALGSAVSGEKVTAVTQSFFGDGVSGEALLLCTDSSLTDLAALMGYQSGQGSAECELILELASILSGSCIQGFCSQLDYVVLLKHPVIFGQHSSLHDILADQSPPWQHTLAIELNYSFEAYDICCDLILLFHEDSLPSLFEKIRLLIE